MKRLWTGKTAREEIISFASVRANVLHFATPPMSRMERSAERMRKRMERTAIQRAIADVIDDWRRCPEGSIKYEMGRYAERLSGAALERLCRDIQKAR